MSVISSKLSKQKKIARYVIDILAVYCSESSIPIPLDDAMTKIRQKYSGKNEKQKPVVVKGIMYILEGADGSHVIVIKSHNNKQILESFSIKSVGAPQVGQISMQSLVFLPVLNQDFKSELFVFHPNTATAQEVAIKLVKLMQLKGMYHQDVLASTSPTGSDLDVRHSHNYNPMANDQEDNRLDMLSEYSLSSTFINNWFSRIDNMVTATPNSLNPSTEYSPSTNSPIDDPSTLNQILREIRRFMCNLYTLIQKAEISNSKMTRIVKLPSRKRFIEIVKNIKISLNMAAACESIITKPAAKEIINQLLLILKIIGDITTDKRTGTSYLILGISEPYINNITVKYLNENLTPIHKHFWMTLGKNYGYDEPLHSYQSSSHKETINEFHVHHQVNQRNYEHINVEGYDRNHDKDAKNDYGFNNQMYLSRDNVMHHESQYRIPNISDVDTSSEEDYKEQKIYRSYLHMKDSDRQTPHLPDSGSSMHQQSGKPSRNYDCYTHSDSSTWDDRQCRFIDAVRLRNGRLMKITRDRSAQNTREISVSCNEIVELLTEYGDMFYVKNALGQIGHCPATIAVHITSSSL